MDRWVRKDIDTEYLAEMDLNAKGTEKLWMIHLDKEKQD